MRYERKDIIMKRKMIALALAALLAVPTVGTIVAAQETSTPVTSEAKTEEKVIYLSSEKGNDMNNGESEYRPVATLKKAIELLGSEGGTIKIVGIYEHAEGFGESAKRGHITLCGADGSSKLIYTKTWGIGGDTTIENINWEVNANSIFLLAKGYTLEIGTGVTVTKGQNVGNYMSIRGGGDTNVIDGDTHIIIRSGTFSAIYGGTANRNVNGNTLIEIYGGTFTAGINGGNNSYIKDSPGQITGNTTIRIYGGDFTNCTGFSGSDGSDHAKVLGTRTLDLRKYNGEIPGDLMKNFDKVLFPITKKNYEINADAKYITGYDNGDGTFRFNPAGNITRAEAVTIISRLLIGAEDLKGNVTSAYTDVSSEAWYHDSIAILEDAGYLQYFEGAFEPDKKITRAEFVEILANIGKGTFKNVSFTDIDDSHPLYASVRWAASNGIVNGYDNGDGTFSFKPDGDITRAEAVTVINRFIGRNTVTAEKYYFTDVADHWAASQIEASAYPEKAGKTATLKGEIDALEPSAKNYINYAKTQDAKSADKVVEAVEYGAEKLEESIRNTKSEYKLGEGNRFWYVSPKGDDKNDGLTPETAKKTVGHIGAEDGKLKPGDVVLFERGGEWRGQKLWTKPGVTYSAYGEGPKPILNRSPLDGADKSLWTLVEGTTNIWKYTGKIMDCGTLVLDNEKHAYKHIPAYINGKYMVRNTNNVFDPVKHLTKDLDFVQLDYTKVGTNPSLDQTDCYGTLYFRCDNGNPGEVFKSIEFAVRDHGMVCMKNVTIDNIEVRNAGAHGISSGNCAGLTVRNCVFEWIGGGIQGYTNGYPTRYGNAIETWGKSDDMHVYNNYINQVYDAGITNQFRQDAGTDPCYFKNSHFHGNVIRNAKYPIEIFLHQDYTDETNMINGLLIEDNYFMDIGKGLPQQAADGTTAAGIKGGGQQNPAKEYVVKNNVFFTSTSSLFEIGAAKPEFLAKLQGNIYVQNLGAKLGVYNKINYAFDAKAQEHFDSMGENGEVVIYFK